MILSRLECGDTEFAETFRRHIHFGIWDDPNNAYDDVADSITAMDRLCQHLIKLADIRDGQSILDVGCGFGGTLASLNEQFSGARLTGLNIDERQINVARSRLDIRRGNHLDLVVGDACAMTFAETSFDRILAVECIFHFPSRKRFFEHVGRLLRPGGNLTMTDFLLPEGSPLGHFDDAENPLWGQCTAIDLQGYQALADEVGLVMTHIQDISPFVRPTYHFFGKILGQHFPQAQEATEIGQFLMDAGGIGYCTLRFDRS
jgi:ubiquinone/menaquinone biosynthesis C-methylase UbiE